ncbi:MAG: ArgE/DapE family deacylase [Candidatus Aminicenantes bacterium]|nr:ArgE/DapE family deacylase [Candidatus Aminicenantes bacterium]NIM77546.1 ArgE/DapE family deacylase [Candidatus Aminicenantes bacterium]NIN16867.1 ArgE/DapE family deacylase [Candidatus Aminicenantes bacterium]NIN40755.1 ArgE/DapE family deacylase [Candidatus Aminicenantes bacterium]NIN83564.1 ArgE/DapE family deacylase [Candidatus Aminicenantes bacterium]
MLEETILKQVDDQKRQIVNTLCELIAIPTANPPGRSYRQCIQYLSTMLQAWEIEHRTITVPYKDNDRFSIIGSYGKGNKGLHFHGHYDVVPADSPDQFQPEVKNDSVYGRGSADMKSGLAAILFAIHIIKEMGIKPEGKLTFSIVPDEETGGKLGTEHLFKSGYLPLPSTSLLGMVMPEPTSGKIWNASKGALTCRIRIKGKFAHVGLAHQGENAFEYMVTLANDFLKLKKKIDTRKTRLPIEPREANRSIMLIGGETGSGANFNTVPENAFFTIDRRFNPEEKLEEVKQEINQILDEHREKGIKLETDVIQEADSSMSGTKTRVAEALQQSIAYVTGKEPGFILCPGVCETRFFTREGVPAYAYGPGLLEHAHSPKEFVALNSVLDCTKIYALTALKLLTSMVT